MIGHHGGKGELELFGAVGAAPPESAVGVAAISHPLAVLGEAKQARRDTGEIRNKNFLAGIVADQLPSLLIDGKEYLLPVRAESRRADAVGAEIELDGSPRAFAYPACGFLNRPQALHAVMRGAKHKISPVRSPVTSRFSFPPLRGGRLPTERHRMKVAAVYG